MTEADLVRAVVSIVYYLNFHPGEVVEIRAFGLRVKHKAWGNVWPNGIVGGYFDNPVKFLEAVMALHAAGASGIYFTPNPCKKDLLARANNRLVAVNNKTPLTSDKDIDCIRWLLIDIDPIRPTGISSSQDELTAAENVAHQVTEYLENELGFSRGIRALSGNGYHIIYRLPDLPNTPEISGRNGLIHRCLKALSQKFDNDLIKIDQVVYNAARIWKLYGTWARKGDSTEERPHRQSMLIKDLR